MDGSSDWGLPILVSLPGLAACLPTSGVDVDVDASPAPWTEPRTAPPAPVFVLILSPGGVRDRAPVLIANCGVLGLRIGMDSQQFVCLPGGHCRVEASDARILSTF